MQDRYSLQRFALEEFRAWKMTDRDRAGDGAVVVRCAECSFERGVGDAADSQHLDYAVSSAESPCPVCNSKATEIHVEVSAFV